MRDGGSPAIVQGKLKALSVMRADVRVRRSRGKGAGAALHLFNIPLQAWLHAGAFLGGREPGQKFWHICI